MRRYVSATRAAAGGTVVTVSLVDGELSSKYSVKSYGSTTAEAVVLAERYARQNLQGLKDGLDKINEEGPDAASDLRAS